MASDRTRERVEEFMGRAGLGDVSFGCADLCDCERCKRAWTALLDAFEREMRLDEHRKKPCRLCAWGWPIQNGRHYQVYKDGHQFFDCHALAAQPTPEVKK